MSVDRAEGKTKLPNIIFAAIGLVAAAFVFFFNLKHHITNYSPQELSALIGSSSVDAVINNPINLLMKVPLLLLNLVGADNIMWTRFVAATFATISVGLFYYLVKSFFSRRVAVLATIMFTLSSSMLFIGRLGAPFVLQVFGLLSLLALAPVWQKYRHKLWFYYIAVLLVAISVYTPGLIWLTVIGLTIFIPKALTELMRLKPVHRIGLSTLFAASVAPLIVAIVRDTSLLPQILNINLALPDMAVITERAKMIVLSFLWTSNLSADISLTGAALLNMTEIGLLIFGFWTVIKSIRLRRSQFMLLGFLFSILLFILGNGASYAFLLPFIYLFVATGVYYLLKQWRKVFPVNPVANSLGTFFMAIVVLSSVIYSFRAYFVGWPHSAETHSLYTISDKTTVDSLKDIR